MQFWTELADMFGISVYKSLRLFPLDWYRKIHYLTRRLYRQRTIPHWRRDAHT